MSAALSATLSAAERIDRARRIGILVGRVYLGIKANQILARGLPRDHRQRRWQRFHRESAEAVYRHAIELRGMIMKSCQYLGARADLMPREWVEVLSRLQDRVPARELPVIRRIVEKELGRPLEVLFRRFSSRPLAAATLAQVHAAELHDGRRVAVKVQYPEVAELMRSDLANLRTIFRAIDWLEPDFDLVPLVEELGRFVPRELDFIAEAHNAERIARMFESRPDVHVPRVHRVLTTRRVLVMDRVDAIKITDREALEAARVDIDQVARLLAEAYAQQILVHGFFHADPHPGNLMVDPDGPRLVFLDFGLARSLPAHFRADGVALLLAVLRRNPEEMADCLARLGFATRDGSRDGLVALARTGLALIRELAETGARGGDRLEQLGEELVEKIRTNPLVRIPTHVVLLARTLGLLSGVARSLGARVEPAQVLFPYLMGSAPPVSGAGRRPE